MTHLVVCEPTLTISPRLLTLVESVAALRERIQGAAVELTWVPALLKDSRARNVHASTAIEGNPLTLEEVQVIEEGRELAADPRSKREVVNYFMGLRYVEKHARKKIISHEDVFVLHRLLAKGVMDQGEAGRYHISRSGWDRMFLPHREMCRGSCSNSCNGGTAAQTSYPQF